MKKITVLLWIVLLFPSITYAQEKVEAPVWNVGDKWVFTEGNIEVVGADEKSYTLNFSKDICIHQSKGFEKTIFDKSTLTRIYGLKGNKREKYAASGGRILNFPFYPGKKWHYTTYTEILTGRLKGTMQSAFNAFKVLGWENVKVQAGNFRTIKLEHFAEITAVRVSGAAIYWYAPEVKYFVKCQYDTGFWKVPDWELASFKLKE